MTQRLTGDKLIAAIIEGADRSDKKDKIYAYISETAQRCVQLCGTGENLRVLNEFKFMVENLAKELGV